MTDPTSPVTAGTSAAHPHPGTSAGGRSTTDQIASVLAAPVTVAQRVLPDSPVPVALGLAALAVVGVVDLPVAVAVGLGYVALRQWNRSE
jgi:hypothetical protein